MTPEAQRIAIAEACGFTNVHPVIIRNVTGCGDDRQCGIASDQGWLPDYLSDLNAMHEAENVLTVGQKENDFQTHLNDVVARDRDGLTLGLLTYLSVHATAAQRAEAFLRTLGLWEG